MADAHLEVDSLGAGMATLPQEIWDRIYEDVFTAPPGIRVVRRKHIEDCHPHENFPQATYLRESGALLQVSRATRALYSKTLYGHGAVIEVQQHFEIEPSMLLLKWLHQIPSHHRALLQLIRIQHGEKDESPCHLRNLVHYYKNVVRRDFDDAVAAKVFLQADGIDYP